MKSKSIILGLLVVSGLLLVILGWEPISAATRKIRPTAFTGKNTIKQVSKTSLLGAWDFNECEVCTTVKDLSGNGRDGTTYNNYGTNAVNLRSSDGIRGRSVILDGVNDYVSMADNDVWDFAGDFTISVWANFTSVNTAGDWHETPFIAHDAGSGAGTRKWIFTYDGDASANTLFHINSPGSCSANIEGNDWTPLTGVWYHVALTRVGTTYTFYRDGKSNGSTVDTCGFLNAGAPLLIGWAEGGAKVFDGRIDEVKIYTRALSESEIEKLYNENRLPIKANVDQNNKFTNGLVGFWPFNGKDLSGTTATDRSGAGINATLNNGPVAIPGIIGQALKFDGSNDTVTTASVVTTAVDNITLSAWVKWSGGTGTVSPDNDQMIIYNGSSASNGWGIYLDAGNSNKIRGLSGLVGFMDTPSAVTLSIGQWTHVVLVRDATNWQIYIDGVSQSVSSAIIPITPTVSTKIGGVNGTFNGVIDEPRIYDRALGAVEILQLYNSGKH